MHDDITAADKKVKLANNITKHVFIKISFNLNFLGSLIEHDYASIIGIENPANFMKDTSMVQKAFEYRLSLH